MILADVNIHFTSIRDFVPTPELDLFKAFHIDLVHGWVVDPAIRDCESWVPRGGGCQFWLKQRIAALFFFLMNANARYWFLGSPHDLSIPRLNRLTADVLWAAVADGLVAG